jgi:alanine racemase
VTVGACARINLGAVRHNFQTIRNKAPGCRTIAVIKGNAYGHGLLACARTLSDADAFGVARLSEAKALREAGVDKSLVLLGGVFSRGDLDVAVDLGASPCIHSDEQITWVEDYDGPKLSVWLKIDTGMNRLGFRLEEAAAAIARLQNCRSVTDLKIMTHFANADNPADETTNIQIDRFKRVIEGFSGDVSIANSAGLFGWAEALREFEDVAYTGRLWIRPGIALYGVSPIAGRSAAELGLRAAMQFESRLILVKPVLAGERVGYGGTWQSDRDSRLGVVAVGYGDGYTRYIPCGTPVIVNGRPVPVAGVISMDLTVVDLGPGAADRAGDTVILWGHELPVETVAEYAGTVPYQLVTGVTHREQPIYE